MNKVKLRRQQKRKKPNFLRQEYVRKPGFSKSGWRSPRGKDSKMRKGKKSKPRVPSVGYGSPKEIRGFHSSGKAEVLVRSAKDLENVKNVVLRLSRRLGKRKKLEMMKKAEELKLRILNPVKTGKKKILTKKLSDTPVSEAIKK